ncbi:hypothetical protein SAMN00768000_1728 [Sulfobacillus thermosulfidooxidans DSM 9293]|uniref:Uncharacterized protein n=1 Tax=Sulfobacillus thermosulfidooxidans (strain DSM 9293 / VKM B-1269 / AT-1) TaxID=929705 RepID=A0A1W1WEI5_SULTA|nr:hypothetical protein [Sulfobacillus thermosulfidooxidans]SMC04579.1 hypothetical protein SAMN00768000_1728 [Sulfobacillus thermosulfidooxidans DSM 9293]
MPAVHFMTRTTLSDSGKLATQGIREKHGHNEAKFSRVVAHKLGGRKSRVSHRAHENSVLKSPTTLRLSSKWVKVKKVQVKKTLSRPSPTSHHPYRLHTQHQLIARKHSHSHKKHQLPREAVLGTVVPGLLLGSMHTGHELETTLVGHVMRQVSLHKANSGSLKSGLASQSQITLRKAPQPPNLLTNSESLGNSHRNPSTTETGTTPKLVFIRKFTMPTIRRSVSLSGKKTLQSSGNTKLLPKRRKDSGEITSGGLGGISSIEPNPSPIALKASVMSPSNGVPVHAILGQAIHKGILQRHVGGWVIKPVHWKAPNGTPGSKWILTMPKQSGPLIMTLLHMQNSWKVNFEVNSAGLAGALAENLGQVQNITAASLPVSQVSVFLGMGQNAMGQGNSSQGGGYFGALYEPPMQPMPWRARHGTATSVRHPSLKSQTAVDYQA